MGHSEDDAVHKIPQKMKMHWQNQLKISVLVWFKILYRISYIRIDVILVQYPFRKLCNWYEFYLPSVSLFPLISLKEISYKNSGGRKILATSIGFSRFEVPVGFDRQFNDEDHWHSCPELSLHEIWDDNWLIASIWCDLIVNEGKTAYHSSQQNI